MYSKRRRISRVVTISDSNLINNNTVINKHYIINKQGNICLLSFFYFTLWCS